MAVTDGTDPAAEPLPPPEPTLRPEATPTGDADSGIGGPIPTSKVKGTTRQSYVEDVALSKQAARDAERAFNKYLSDNPDVKVSSGRVVRDSAGSDSGGGNRFLSDNSTTSKSALDTTGTSLLNALNAAKDSLKWDEEDLKGFKAAGGSGGGSGGGGTARAYAGAELDPAVQFLKGEKLKTGEITRQLNDFEDRASAYDRYQADEQKYGMNADDQNIQNEQAFRRGDIGGMGFATHMPMSSSLSNILRPSIPDYVRPDYRLNGAVGLPGPQGFDDPNYDESGMPRYALGTDASRIPPGIPPDLLKMVGVPVTVPIPKPGPGFTWPWSVKRG